MKTIAAVIERVSQERTWEEVVSEGMEARSSMDNSQWKLGDLALEVCTNYGEDSIGKYSYAIGKEKKTLMNYRTVSNKFPQEMRNKYPKLSFSHFASLTKLEKPEAWLEKADDEDWSVEMLRKHVNDECLNAEAPELSDEVPEGYRCETCGLWRFKDVSSFDVCKGHYKIEKDGITYE